MIKSNVFMAFFIVFAILILSCNQPGTRLSSPSIPTGLESGGRLGFIDLTWDVSSGGNLTGYDVYKSSDGANFSKTGDSPVTGTTYHDVIATPADDGKIYYYKVTAVGDLESDCSQSVQGIHGTRLDTYYASGAELLIGNSPYVIDRSVTVEGGHLRLYPNSKLYILGNVTVDIEQSYWLYVQGLLRTLSTAASPVNFTSHRVGSDLADNEGFRLKFYNDCVDYDPTTDTGTLIEYASIDNLANSNQAVYVEFCAPMIRSCKITANSAFGTSYFEINENPGFVLKNCTLDKIVLTFKADYRNSGFLIEKNISTNGYYSFYFSNWGNVISGQIINNVFDGSNEAYLFNLDETNDNIPLGNNYWIDGTPALNIAGTTTITADFTPVLGSQPADAGAGW